MIMNVYMTSMLFYFNSYLIFLSLIDVIFVSNEHSLINFFLNLLTLMMEIVH